MDDLFERCQKIATALANREDSQARRDLILLLDAMERNNVSKNPLVNHLIREVGLYPHIDPKSALFGDALIKEMFTVDVGGNTYATLHREQSKLLKELANGESLVVSAPTSFGKSFVVDALLRIRHPNNVMIIVPTIALADETRRRLNRKFASEYKIITTSDVRLGTKNMFVFPAERAASYFRTVATLDLLVVDEFYKVSSEYDKERHLALVKLITQLRNKAKQCYFLAPNIDKVFENPFIRGMKPVRFDLSTVVLNYHHDYRNLKKGNQSKADRLKDLLEANAGQKTLVYVKSVPEMGHVVDSILNWRQECTHSSLIRSFAEWFSENYAPQGAIANGALCGILQHHGGLHRAVAQIVVRLFEDCEDADILIATSSLIEGVNTSAKNVILWNNKKGTPKLDSFSFRNISGRAGRMFRHFVGDIYCLEQPPDVCEQATLDIDIPESELPLFNDSTSRQYLTEEQIKAIKTKENTLISKYGSEFYRKVLVDNSLVSIGLDYLDMAVMDIRGWQTKNYFQPLLDADVQKWKEPLEILLGTIYCRRCHKYFQDDFEKLIEIILHLPGNWKHPTSIILELLHRQYGVGVDDFFKAERAISYPVANLLKDINIISQALDSNATDISLFAKQLSVVFLPPRVYELEEYGLPRMIARKIQSSGLIDLEREVPLESILDDFRRLGLDQIKDSVPGLQEFDKYILDFFFEGITTSINGE